ncbi:TonB-dependent receptor plug domain-containing protein [Cellvibrio polysaccharolyticus]|uniref:TonB-dependent receptor n=1 Tax=Cellvibrio polysaccharolyticus TaxID=2082724 RepID=A0A928V0K8_9GAMM|nr:TonB-dependent receptor plug domain-containing protein [Cellvibrio polysaccharolyticus]MBE8716620.1 TonB-dependent receptor [Cellvibrio polysaccharolyticus]
MNVVKSFRKKLIADVVRTSLWVSAASAIAAPVFAAEHWSVTLAGQNSASVETVLVEGRKSTVGENILPVRTVKGIYGTEATVVDTPRSIGQINVEQLNRDPIFSADDLTKYAPGLTKGGGQNAGIAPQFRAQGAEVYQDGQRTYSVRHPTNLNAYEGADIIAGPSSVIFGSATGSGGYVNYLSKKPDFEQQRTRLSGVLGTWIPDGNSKNGTRFTVDTTGPISDDVAYRVSVTRQRWDDYYDHVENNFDAFYGAVAWQPSANLRVDWNASYDDYFDWNVTHGWNRPSQELVNGKYWAGRSTPIIQNGSNYWSPVFESGAANSALLGWERRQLETATGRYTVVPDSFQVANPNTQAAPGAVRGWVYDPNLAGNGLVDIDPQVSQRGEDQNTSKRTRSQLRVEWDASDSVTWVNSTYVQVSEDTTDATGTFQVQSKDDLIDNRTEFQWKGEYQLFGLDTRHDSNSGLIYRYERNTSIAGNNSFFHINAYDITQNPSTKSPQFLFGINTLNPAGGNAAWIGSNGGNGVYSDYFGYLNLPSMVAVDNGKKLYAETYASYTSEASWSTTTVFTQHNFLFEDRFGFNIGASGSYVDADIENPLANLDPQKRKRQDSGNYNLYAAQASVYFKPTTDSSIYFTADRSQAINTGGFANTLSWGANDKLNALTFDSLSELYEIGYKTTLGENLFFTLAAFDQARDTSPDQFNNIARLNVKGYETSLRFQPGTHFKTGINATKIEAYNEYQSQSGFAPRGFVPDNGTVFSDSNVLNRLPSGNFDQIHIPEYNVAAYADYTFESGFGVEVSAWWTSDWYVNLSRSVHIPNSYNVDTTFYYRQPAWSVAVQVLNVTDELNFVNGQGSATSTFLQPMRGRSVQAQVEYRF